MPWCWNWQNPYTTGKQARLKVKMAELADAYGSEPYGATLEGSTPSLDTGVRACPVTNEVSFTGFKSLPGHQNYMPGWRNGRRDGHNALCFARSYANVRAITSWGGGIGRHVSLKS